MRVGPFGERSKCRSKRITIEIEETEETKTGKPARTSIDVVVVNWNTSSQAVQAARGYASSDAVETRVFVFDNDSLPEEAEILTSRIGTSVSGPPRIR